MPTYSRSVTANMGALITILRGIALSPTLTGTLLLLLTKGPPSLRDRFLTAFPALRRDRNFAALLTALKVLCGVGAVTTVNDRLNQLAREHWCWRQPGERFVFEGPSERGEVVVVTGGCSGFGLGIARGLVGKCRVVVVDRQDLPGELEGRAGLYYYRCDLTSRDDIASTAAAIRIDAGDPTVLINNAGIASSAIILETKPENLERLFRVNLLSHWLTIQEFLPSMLEKKKGHIITMASMASYYTAASMVDYCASKAGVLALHEGLNAELASKYVNGEYIRTTVVHPMWAATPIIDDWTATLKNAGTPILHPNEIIEPVVAQVLKGTSAQIYVPSSASRVAGLRGWPTWVQEWMRLGSTLGNVRKAKTG